VSARSAIHRGPRSLVITPSRLSMIDQRRDRRQATTR
jgi:hypothetical protein